MWMLSRIHPAFRRRNQAARHALQNRPWRAVTEHWFAAERDQWRQRNTELGAVDPSSLDERRLADHLRACRQHVTSGYLRHFELHGSLYAALAENYGVTPAEADETIETALATPREADLLGTDVGIPMLLLSRHSFDDGGRPVEWVRSIYRGDRYKFVARLRRPES